VTDDPLTTLLEAMTRRGTGSFQYPPHAALAALAAVEQLVQAARGLEGAAEQVLDAYDSGTDLISALWDLRAALPAREENA
jgi:hypothetical protein